MAKKRVHEIAKAQGVTSKELIAALGSAGVEVKAAASGVDEQTALEALRSADGASAEKPKAKSKAPAKAQAPVKPKA
ncbi:MAG: translation initiation factor IF-2 N-terminal domain-containing protein, partial [bacterium]